MKKDVKLYNVFFPLWMFWLLSPIVFLICIASNFLIDSAVVLICAAVLKIANKKEFYKKRVLKVYLLGFSADLVGFSLMMIFMYVGISPMGDEWYLTIPTLIITAFLLYFFNYKISFKDLEKSQRIKFSLTVAIATAPYTFLVPSSWLYG